ncbi:type II secretion system protein J [Marinicella sediminis]|uniref:Type II secretion system protein J n=1 Tax=Marinicella sediminis TaxID=1792834 RepID=A0ABV7J8B7_9GAMM
MRIQHQSGMTLIELLIATGILAVLAGLAFISLDNLIRSKQTIDQHSKQLNQYRRVLYMLQDDLQLAVTSQQSATSQAEFLGEPQRITLNKYQVPQATSIHAEQALGQFRQQLRTINWQFINGALYRTDSPAHSAAQVNAFDGQKMLELNRFYCEYNNDVGLGVSRWPASPAQNSRLPGTVICQLEFKDGTSTELLVTPWQSIW